MLGEITWLKQLAQPAFDNIYLSMRAIRVNYRISIKNIWISKDLVEQTEKWSWDSNVSLLFDVVIANKAAKIGRSNDQRNISVFCVHFCVQKRMLKVTGENCVLFYV